MAGAGVAQPSADGALVYLDAGPSLDVTLARVAAHGGRITTPRVDLPGGMGCFAHVLDSEGNRVGLHAMA
jgi:predicted enzyme related to lactoylglutathione lyase